MTHALMDEFALEQIGPARFRRVIGPGWDNSRGIVFGGYTAALACAAATSATPHPAIGCAHLMFLNPVQPGLIEFEVFPERIGRSAAAVRVVGMQDGKQIVISQCWLRPAPTALPQTGTVADWRGPDQATPIVWLKSLHSFQRWFESRAVDYPSSAETFYDGKSSIDLWSHPASGPLSMGTQTQMFDILVADAHLGNGTPRGQPLHPATLVTLDLYIQWLPDLHRSGWRRIQGATSQTSQDFTMCSGTIFDEMGAVCATVSQQIMRLGERRA